jgi:hypothetical protein
MAARKSTPPDAPEVIVDFTFDRGLLHVAVINISDAPATEVTVSFDLPFRGLNGEVEVSSLPMFRRIAFLAPHKRIETLVDTSAAYFERDEPTAIVATIGYRDAADRAHQRRIAHDLLIYRDIAYVVSPPPAGTDAPPAGRTPDATTRPTPDTGTVRHGRPQG